MLKEKNCGSVSESDLNKSIILAGWVHRKRDHGGISFLDLRDRSGLVQIVVEPENVELAEIGNNLRNEWVVQVKGIVRTRPAGTENLELPTGKYEVLVEEINILSESETPPFYINEDIDVDENLRLRYRYMDLRKAKMQRNLHIRHEILKSIREFCNKNGFWEIETPILLNSSPEGARDFLVPSRLQPGKFYALPQSPQQLKQLLMVSGYEKYYQIARCFRDEDLRADRQPEFTQLDVELSFVEESDVIKILEDLHINIVEKVRPDAKMEVPFPRLTYKEAIERYGTDRPDLRFGMEFIDFTDLFSETDFMVFKKVIESGGKIKGVVIPEGHNISRKYLDQLTELSKEEGAGGLVWLSIKDIKNPDNISENNIQSPVAKHLGFDLIKNIIHKSEIVHEGVILIVADVPNVVHSVLDVIRRKIGDDLNLKDSSLLSFCFITDWPLVEWNEDEKRWDAMRHPFTSFKEEDAKFLDKEPQKVRCKDYDLVCNGWELGGGSIRVNKPDIQEKIFQVLGLNNRVIQERFGHMIEAFKFGAPPHGGFATGIDRTVAILAGAENIREVIAFPKTQIGSDQLFGSPSEVEINQLKELRIKKY